MRFIEPHWAAPHNIHTLVTTREGGVSLAPFASFNLGEHVGDKLAAVALNRQRLNQHLPSEPMWLTQTHSTIVNTPQVREKAKGNIICADAVVSKTPNEVLAIMTADCLPVLFTSTDGSVIGAAHAGWRGLCAGILENTVAEMIKLSPALQAQEILAWMGPAIGPESFEVGEDVVQAFANDGMSTAAGAFKAINERPGKYLADIYHLARIRLEHLGLISITGGDRCTVKESQDFFSYRRDGVTGRFASLIWISN